MRKIEESIDDHFCMLGPRIREQRTAMIVKDATSNMAQSDSRKDKRTTGSTSQAGGSTNRSVQSSKSGVPRVSKATSKSRRGRTCADNEWLRASIAKTIQDDESLKFHKFTYKQKLDKLEDMSWELTTIDRSRKENRRTISTICRMTSNINQSYFLMDQTENDEARQIYYKPVKKKVNAEEEEIKKILGGLEEEDGEGGVEKMAETTQKRVDKALNVKEDLQKMDKDKAFHEIKGKYRAEGIEEVDEDEDQDDQYDQPMRADSEGAGH